MKKYLFIFLLLFAIAKSNAQTCTTTYGSVTVNTTCEQLSHSPYYYNNTGYYYGGTYTVHLINYKGCDSVVTLNIYAPGPGSTYTNMTVKACQLPMWWKCQDITGPGTYSCAWDVGNPECGDSVDYLNLTVLPADTIKIYDTICQIGMPYYWHFNTYYEDGIYWANVSTPNGSCLTEELHLTLDYHQESLTEVTVCANKLPYQWNGKSYAAAGWYPVSIKTGSRCDSVAVLSLAVTPNPTSATTVSVCVNQLPYTWNGQSLTATGSYTATIPRAGGCDSMPKLNLTVKQLATISSFTPVAGSTGQAVVITGTNFTGATAVSFGGTPATSFSVQSATSIIATVGQGASGAVSVTIPCNTVSLAGFSHNSSSGNIGIGTNSAPSKLTVGGGDVYITDIGSGIILKSPDGNCWRVTIDNSGNLVRTKITCPQ